MAQYVKINDFSATNASTLSMTNIFSAKYNVYDIFIDDMDTTTLTWIRGRLIDASDNVLSNSVYDESTMELLNHVTFIDSYGINQTAWNRLMRGYDQSFAWGGMKLTIFNPFSSSDYTHAICESTGEQSGSMFGARSSFVYTANTSCTGFQIASGDGNNMDDIFVKVYGYKA
tara:strand:- start:613 stop:1128 length:516 start_codon:yes stop_codon:yes gene_type:complete